MEAKVVLIRTAKWLPHARMGPRTVRRRLFIESCALIRETSTVRVRHNVQEVVRPSIRWNVSRLIQGTNLIRYRRSPLKLSR